MEPALAITPSVFAAVLAAAAMHAGWNAFLKLRLEPLLAMTLIVVGAGVIGLPFMIGFGPPRPAALPWLFGSVTIHVGYYTALTEAYRRGEMSQVYPIARGGGPLLTALVSLLFLTEPLTPRALVGIVMLGGGVILVSLRGQIGGRINAGAVAFALLTSTCIAGYTVVDGIGARTAGNPSSYASSLFVIDALPLPLLALYRRGAGAILALRRQALQGLAGGAMSLGAYWIAIWAMTRAPIPIVAALRETSVLFSAIIAIVVLKERFLPLRGLAACLILAGMVLIRSQ